MGIAYEQDLGGRVGAAAFQILPVDIHRDYIHRCTIRRIMVADGRGGSGATGVSDGREEAVVGGREENDLIAGLRKGFDADRQGRHHGGGVEDPVSFDGPAATALEPGNHRIIITFRYFRVTENPVFDPFAEGVDDTGSRAEIHIGHPHRDDLSGRDPGPVGRIPFDAGGSPAFYERSKVVCHDVLLAR